MKNNIRVIRAELDMTQAALARLAGVSRVTVNRVESGRTLPDGNTILKLAGALGRPATALFPALGVCYNCGGIV